MKRVTISKRVTLELDHTDEATPAIVIMKAVRGNNPEVTSTYDCALASGAVEDYPLTIDELTRLGNHQEAVDKAYDMARPPSSWR